jgi:hypothetical protein
VLVRFGKGLCAVRTANDDSSSKLGRERKEIPPGQPTNLAAKAKGDKRMSGTRGTLEGVYGELYPQDLCDMAKAERL